MTQKTKNTNKSLIFLKSSVIALGIVFVVMIFSFAIITQKKSNKKIEACKNFLALQIAGEVDKIELQGNNIIILTKPNSKTKKQEIIKIDSNCASVINRIELTQ
jgi:hypothetical protein